MAPSCINKSDKNVAKMVKDFGELQTAQLIDRYFDGKAPSYKDFIEHDGVKKELGIIPISRVKAEIGVGFKKEISNKSLYNLEKAVGRANNKLAAAGKKIIYRLFNLGSTRPDSNTWGLRKINTVHGLNVDEKIERLENRARVEGTIPESDELNLLREIKKSKDSEKGSGQLGLFDDDVMFQKPSGNIKPQVNYRLKATKTILDNLTKIKQWESNKSIDQNTFKEASKPTKEQADTEMFKILKQFAAKLGITVDVVENLKERFGNDVNAVADFVNKAILLANGKINEDTLPEEIGHFAIRALRNNQVFKRLLELVENTELYKEVYREYSQDKRYQNKDGSPNISKIKEEAAGKLLAKFIVEKYNEPKNSFWGTISRLLKGLYNSFKGLLRKVPENSIQKEINRLYGGIAEEILTLDTSNFDASKLDAAQDVMFQLDKDSRTYKTILEKAIETLKIRVDIYKSRGITKTTDREEELIEKLEEDLALKRDMLGVFSFLENVVTDLNNIVGTDKLEIPFNFKTGRLDEIREEIDKGFKTVDDLQDIAKRMRIMNGFVTAYKPIINDIIAEIMEDLRGNPESKQDLYKALKAARDVESKIETVNNAYIELGRALSGQFLKMYSSNENLDVNKSLLKAMEDIGFFRRYTDALAESGNDILSLIDRVIKEHKDIARRKSMDYEKALLNWADKLREKGINSTIVMEFDKNGKPTGNFKTDRNYGDWAAAKKKFSEELNKKYGLPEDPEERAKYLDSNDPKIKTKKWAYVKSWRIFHDTHSEPIPEYVEFIKKKEKELSKRDFEEWFYTNMPYGLAQPSYFRGELVRPSKKYAVELPKVGSTEREFYDYIMGLNAELKTMLPPKYINELLMPQIYGDSWERMSSKGVKGVASKMKEGFIRREDDTEFGGKNIITDETGRIVRFIPVHYTTKLEEVEFISKDVIKSMIAFADMSVNYREMNKVVDALELTKDVVAQTDVVQTKGGIPLLNKFSNKEGGAEVTKKAIEGSNLYARLVSAYDMMIYDKKKEDEGTLFGSKIDQAKAIDAFNRYVAINSLGFNVYSGMANVFLGNVVMMQEAVAGEFISVGSLQKARVQYYKHLPETMAQIGKINRTDFISLWEEKFDVLQEHSSRIHGHDTNKSLFKRMFSMSNAFFLNHAGEHSMQIRLSLAMGMEAKLIDKNGNEVDLTKAFKIDGNKLILNGKFKKVAGKIWNKAEDGQYLTEKDLTRFNLKVKFLNKRLHGIYNDIDKSVMQQHALGRAAIMFRKFIKPGFNRRFDKGYYNYEAEVFTEGFYYTTGKFMKNLVIDLKNQQFSLTKSWNELKPHEKANLKRMLSELGYIIAAKTLAFVLSNLAGDDDEDWMLNMIAYQANRLYTELRFFNSYEEGVKPILKSPAAGVNQIQSIIDFIEFWNWGEEIERGKYKGYTKFHRNAIKVVPFYHTFDKLLTPEEQLKFFSGR